MANFENYDEIVEGCLKNNRECQKKLFYSFAPKMLTVCMQYANCKDEAEDILMEGFLKVFTQLGTFKNTCSLEYWIRKLIVNNAIDYYRHHRKEYHNLSFDEEDFPEIANLTDTPIEVDIEAKEVLNIIQKMPEKFKITFNLRIFEQYSFREIGILLGVSENNSRICFFRAKKWFEKQLLIHK